MLQKKVKDSESKCASHWHPARITPISKCGPKNSLGFETHEFLIKFHHSSTLRIQICPKKGISMDFPYIPIPGMGLRPQILLDREGSNS